MQQEPDSSEQGPERSRLIPLTRWCAYHPWPTTQGLRWLVWNAEKNGFRRVIKRVGRRVLIDERSFFDWVASKDNEAQ